MPRVLLRLLLVAKALVPTVPRLVFDSVAHIGSLPAARADSDFLLSFMQLGAGAGAGAGAGTRLVVTGAPNGSTLASTDAGASWSLQHSAASVPTGSYAAWPTVYANRGGWPPQTGLPLAFATAVLSATYEPPAPARFNYTGTLLTVSAEKPAACVKTVGGKMPAVGARVSWNYLNRDTSLCAFPTNGSETIYEGHVCATDGSIMWDNFSTPYHTIVAHCAWSCAAASAYCGTTCGGSAMNNPSLPTKVCSAASASASDSFHVTADGPTVRYTGLPAAAVQFIPGDGNVVRLQNGTWIATVGVWLARDAPTNVSSPDVRCCNDSVAVFRSDDFSNGLDWEFVAMVAGPRRFKGSDEGPNENALVLHPDGETLTIFLRTAGGEGYPQHQHEPYWKAQSTDGGASWLNWSQTPDAVKSGRPAHASFAIEGTNTLLLSSGRPALGLHESPDGIGESWVSYDIPTQHNILMKDPALRFCKEFQHAALNGSLGWTQTSGVTTVATVSADRFLVCYNRVCCPTVRTDCHVEPPAGCKCDGTEAFCMRGRVIPEIPLPPPPPPAPPPEPCVPPMPCLETHGNQTLFFTTVTSDTGLCAPAPGQNVSHVIYSGALCGANGSRAIQWHSAHTVDPRAGLPPQSCAWHFNASSIEGRKHVGGCGSCVHDPYGELRLPTHVCKTDDEAL